MRILNYTFILDFLESANHFVMPKFKTENVQVQIEYECGCKVTEDKTAGSLFPCPAHYEWADSHRAEGVTLHKTLH